MEEFKSRPKIDVDKLDFSEFHPLDHNVWQCRDYPGGRKTHLKYRWEFQWEQALHAKTKCKLGSHCQSQAWQGSSTWKMCLCCGKRLSEPQPE